MTPPTNDVVVVRPTEAQLRWAQFHHKRRSKGVKLTVERMWKTPLEVADVPGALPEDGNSTTESESKTRAVPCSKPKISRGRRAMLRVSKRIYQRRREEIQRFGYQTPQLGDAKDDDEEEEEDGLEAIFTAESKHRKRNRRHQKQPGDEERLKRFEAACHAMMMNLAAPPKLSIVVPTRIWTRNSDLAGASLDQEYDDLKWGIRRRPQSKDDPSGGLHATGMHTMTPLDKEASWMIYLPKHHPAARDDPYFPHPPQGSVASGPSDHTGTTSLAERTPGRSKFDQLVALAQQQMIARTNPGPSPGGAQPLGTAPRMRLRYLTTIVAGETMEEEKKVGEAIPRRKPHPLSERFMGISPDSDQLHRPKPERSVGTSEMTCTHCSRVSPVGSTTASDFFAQMRSLNYDEMPLMGSPETPASSSQGRNSDGPVPCVEGVCEDCQKNYRTNLEGSETFRNHENGIYSSSSPSHAHDDEWREQRIDEGRLSQLSNPRLSSLHHEDEKSDHSKESTLSDLWFRGRSSVGNVISSTGNAIASTLNAIPESNRHLSGNEATPTSSSGPANLKARVESVSGRVSGFFSMFSGRPDDNDSNEVEAVAAFRKSQDKRRESMTDDDASSVSSHRVLPRSIRDVVLGSSGAQKFGGSPSRCMSGRSSVVSELSPEKYRKFHEQMIRNSALLGDKDQERSVIDTDETTSDASETALDPRKMASILLSPTLLMKRLQQAVRAVEQRNWQQVSYLISANPWLAEMSELTTNQYLLHKLAFYGAGEPPSPDKLNSTLVELFPSAVYKFDRDGNVPLHLAAAAGNLKMVVLLGEKFQGGASIRNEDGMLPLHFTIAAHSDADRTAQRALNSGDDSGNDDDNSPARIIKTVMKLFPNGVAIPDNDGNLPLHIAASCLHGSVGVDVAYLLLDEAERQLQDPCGARFYNKVKMEEFDDSSVSTMSTERETSSSFNGSNGLFHCNNVKNDTGETPLITALRARNGWEMIEAIACGPGGKAAALFQDGEGNNALHHLVSEEFENAAAALSILKVAPESASIRNNQGMLPIEGACMQDFPAEVILALALSDLPFGLDDKDEVKVREGHGGSWWFLTCECDDHYNDIVEEVISICSFQQVRELCFMKGGSNNSSGNVITRATPKARLALTKALRFVGRFEFVGNSALYTDFRIGLKEFDALDFGRGNEEGRRVLLKCFSMKKPFLQQTSVLRDFNLDTAYVEEALTFAVNADESESSEDGQQQYCVSIERPSLTFDRVVAGMMKNEAYRRDPAMRKKYTGKVCTLLRVIAKSLHQLHSSGLVHGDLCMENCGKYDETWKLGATLGMQRIGDKFNTSRWCQSFPPEAVEIAALDEGAHVCDSDDAHVAFKEDLEVDVSIDIWAFGKLAYEVIMVEPLVEFDKEKEAIDDVPALLEIMDWNDESLKAVFHRLSDVGISVDGAELITSCLFPRPEERPKSMGEILSNPFWKEFRKPKDRSRRSKHAEDSVASVSDF